MCVATWNVVVIKRWVKVSSPEEIAQAINIPSPVGTALCMAAAIRNDHEKGNDEVIVSFFSKFMPIFMLSSVLFFFFRSVMFCE